MKLIHFPEHTYSGVANDYANLMSQYFESPKQFWYFAFLTCLGNLLAKTVTLDGGLQTQPRLYTIMLGSSGLSHKSWAGEYTYKFFAELFPKDFPICTGVNSAEGLKNVLKHEGQSLLWFDELQTFIKKASIKGSTLLQIVNELFESNRAEAHKEQHNLIIDPGYLSMMAACTFETYEKVYTEEFLAIGFVNRLWIVPAERNKKIARPRKITENQIQPIREKLYSIYTRCQTGISVGMTINADDDYDRWYQELPDSEYVTRLDGYALKLMILYAISEMSYQVDNNIVRKVCELCNWQLDVRKIYAPYDADNQLAELEQKILRRLNIQPHTERELKQYIRISKYGFGVYGRAIYNLIQQDMIERVISGSTTRLQLID